jgi:hypothetical protein
MFEEAAKKTAEQRQALGEQGSTFMKIFREEVGSLDIVRCAPQSCEVGLISAVSLHVVYAIED